MIPILYEANETAFLTQGIGALGDAVSVKIARVLNGKDELTMVYPSDGIRYADLLNDRIIYAQPEYKKSAQPYQIYKITKPFNGLVTVYARHVGTQRASFIPVLPFSDGSVTGVLTKLPTYMVETNPFTFWTDKSTIADFKLTRPASLGNVLGGMSGSILDVYGGEYEFDGYVIKLWNKRGSDRGVELRYGKNITDIEQSEDFASVVTGVVPYWEGMYGETVTLPENAVYGSLAGSYAFARTIVKDFSERFDEEPTVADLRAAASAYVETVQLPTISLKVNFEHLAQYTEYEGMGLLETVNLGDTVHIYYEPLGVSQAARIVNTTYDCLTEKYDAVQIGSVRGNLEQVMTQMSNTTETLRESVVKNLPSAIETAVENATDLITGVDGGYVILHRDADGKPFEILIMDEERIADATYIIRLNKNGIGFSTDGGSTYANAWTIDGSFVADFITTGTLNAALAKIGVLADAAGKNSWNMETGALSITDGSLNISTSSDSNDLITLGWMDNGGNYTYATMAPGGFTARDWGNAWNRYYSLTKFGIYEYQDVGNYGYPISSILGATLTLGHGDAGVNGQIYLKDTNGDSRVNLYGGSGQISLKDTSGNTRVGIYGSTGGLWLNKAADANTAYFITDTSDTTRARLGMDGLRFYNSSGTQTGYVGNDINDFVVAQATTGSWYYRKWNSGLMELWHTGTFSRTTSQWSAWGNQYVATATAAQTFPNSTVWTAVPMEWATLHSSDGSGWLTNQGTETTTTTSQRYEITRPNKPSATVTFYIHYYFQGFWK